MKGLLKIIGGAIGAIIALAVVFCIIKLAYMPASFRASSCEGGVAVEWEPVDAAISYNVYRKDGDEQWQCIAENISEVSYTDTTAVPREEYTYSVQAVLMNGILSAFPIDGDAFTYEEMPVMTLAENAEYGAYIEWNAVAGAQSYTVYRKEAGDVWRIMGETGEETYYTDTSAVSSVCYQYTVRAVYEDGTAGVKSNSGIELTYMRTPEMGEAEATGSGITISWKDVDGAAKYIIYRKTADTDWDALTETEDVSYEDADIDAGVEYAYAVQAVGEDGTNSAYSSEGKKCTWTAAKAAVSTLTSSTGAASSYESATIDNTTPYVRASGYYPVSYSIGFSGDYNLSTSDYNMGLKVIKVKEYLVSIGMLAKNWDVGTDAWTTYSYETSVAVSNFQANNGLSATGVVDLATWQAMGFSESDWYSLGAYVTPVKVNSSSTQADYIEAMVQTATAYLNAGTSYGGGCSGAPGTAADCSGLILQCLYSAGINPSSVSVVSHARVENVFGSRILGNDGALGITVSSPQRGDLIFYYSGSTITHVALYIGNGYVIESQTYMGVVMRSMWASGSSHKYVRLFW